MNLIQTARKTISEDRKYYRRKGRSQTVKSTVKSLVHWLNPNLKNPVFIVGSPRSGTTFLGRCLETLPEFSYHFEPVATKAAAKHVYKGEWSAGKARFFYQQAYASLMRLHFDGDLRFAEKTPRNCFLVDFLADTFPGARFIHIIRDGRDVALSYSKKPWLQAAQAPSQKIEPGGYPYGPFARFWVEAERVQEFETTSDIHRCIWAWRRFTEAVLMGGVQSSQESYLELRYEDLVSSPRLSSERLLDFLNIENVRSRLQFKTATASANPQLIGQWRNELTADQLSQIESEAGELLNQLGYVK
ncbi:MAG: sulfotransferase [Cyanobacteria bacterium P01_A01_bin.114]